MFKRKIEKYLKEWKSDEHKMPLIIKGCRQCGKTFSVLDFAHKNYEHVVYLDFFQHPEYKSVFDGGQGRNVNEAETTVRSGGMKR